jgi:hypothetical protein
MNVPKIEFIRFFLCDVDVLFLRKAFPNPLCWVLIWLTDIFPFSLTVWSVHKSSVSSSKQGWQMENYLPGHFSFPFLDWVGTWSLGIRKTVVVSSRMSFLSSQKNNTLVGFLFVGWHGSIAQAHIYVFVCM